MRILTKTCFNFQIQNDDTNTAGIFGTEVYQGPIRYIVMLEWGSATGFFMFYIFCLYCSKNELSHVNDVWHTVTSCPPAILQVNFLQLLLRNTNSVTPSGIFSSRPTNETTFLQE